MGNLKVIYVLGNVNRTLVLLGSYLKFPSSMNETWQLSVKLCEGFHKNRKTRVLTRSELYKMCAHLRCQKMEFQMDR
jgi:hypothetical protein